MKKLFCLLSLLFTASCFCFAQLTPEQRIQDSVIGWWSNNKYDHLKPQTDPIGKKKEALVNKMVEWMKKSYTPVAGLGTSSRYIHNRGYGVDFLVWNVSHDKMWLDEKGNFRPIPEENTKFHMAANRVFGSFPIDFINKPDAFYFTMQPDGYGGSDQVVGGHKKADSRIHPNAYNYITRINDWHTVYLAPGNKLPFIAVTKGELLQQAEAGLEKVLADKRKEKEGYWPDNKKAQDEAMVYEQNKINGYREKIHQLREKHKNTLNEPAIIRSMQVTMYSFETDPDIFSIDNYSKQLKQGYEVYKMDAALLEKMKTDQPQWIAVAFPFETKENGNQLYELFTSMSENINYEYIYNYFFDPEKVKGKAYAPSNEEQLNTRLENYRRKNKADLAAVANTKAWPVGVHFMEDFSSSSEGSDPVNWYFSKYGKHSVVTTLNGQPGKWLKLGYGNQTFPTLLKKPLPENFTLEFDVASDPFTARTGGAVNLYMSTYASLADGGENKNGDGKFIDVTITAGLDEAYKNNINNFMGEARIDIHSSPAVNTQNYSEGLRYKYQLGQFTDKKLKVHVAVQVVNGELKLFINDKQVATSSDFKMTYGGKCINCNVLAGAKFKTVIFKSTTQDWTGFSDDKDVSSYIGNIKIIQN